MNHADSTVEQTHLGALENKGENVVNTGLHHYQQAYASGEMFEIDDEYRLDEYLTFPKYDLWKEDIADIIDNWKKAYPQSDVYDVHKYIVSNN